jgi:signal transduction histidine kinase
MPGNQDLQTGRELYRAHLLEELKLLRQQSKQEEQVEQVLRRLEDRIREVQSVLLMIDSVFGDLNQSLTVIMGLSALLLAKVDQNDPIVTDLNTIAGQVKRIRETIKDLNYLAQYDPMR